MTGFVIWFIGALFTAELMPEKKWVFFNWPEYLGQYFRDRK